MLPLIPQEVLLAGRQLVPWQQVGQVETEQVRGTQVMFEHRSVAAHVRQSPLPLPQLKSSVPS